MRYLIELGVIIFIASTLACKADKSVSEKSNQADLPTLPKLELVWETDTTLATCESVLYDKASDIIYVANINNGPWEKDNNGFISKIDTKGNVIDLKWVEGLSAPKGMGILNGKLYVNDIDRIVVIDINKSAIVNSYYVSGDPALNDITISPDGIVYASGSTSNSIYALSNGKVDTIVTTDFGRLNGLLDQPEGLYYASSGTSEFGLYDKKKDTKTVLTGGIGHGDGIVRLKNNDFVVSSWKGAVFYIKSDGWELQKLIDTESLEMNAADIDYIPQDDLILVPTFFANKVMCYKLVQ